MTPWRRCAPRAPFDAVICDIRLVDGDGEAIFREAGAAGEAPPFLFITAFGDIDQAVRLLRAGGGDYLTKPFAKSCSAASPPSRVHPMTSP